MKSHWLPLATLVLLFYFHRGLWNLTSSLDKCLDMYFWRKHEAGFVTNPAWLYNQPLWCEFLHELLCAQELLPPRPACGFTLEYDARDQPCPTPPDGSIEDLTNQDAEETTVLARLDSDLTMSLEAPRIPPALINTNITLWLSGPS